MTTKQKLRLYQLDLAAEKIRSRQLKEQVDILTYYVSKYKNALKALKEAISL